MGAIIIHYNTLSHTFSSVSRVTHATHHTTPRAFVRAFAPSRTPSSPVGMLWITQPHPSPAPRATIAAPRPRARRQRTRNHSSPSFPTPSTARRASRTSRAPSEPRPMGPPSTARAAAALSRDARMNESLATASATSHATRARRPRAQNMFPHRLRRAASTARVIARHRRVNAPMSTPMTRAADRARHIRRMRWRVIATDAVHVPGV